MGHRRASHRQPYRAQRVLHHPTTSRQGRHRHRRRPVQEPQGPALEDRLCRPVVADAAASRSARQIEELAVPLARCADVAQLRCARSVKLA